MALCKVMIIGNLGSRPGDALHADQPAPVTQFNVAVNQSTKNQQTGEWVEETDWFRVSVWGDRAERMAESLRKGNKVFVEGRFRTREFEGRDGQKRTSLEITADSIVNLERTSRDDEGSFGGPGGSRQGWRASLLRWRWRRRRRPAPDGRPAATSDRRAADRRHRPRRPSFLTTD